MQEESLWQMLIKGGPTMLLLALCSIASWVVILESRLGVLGTLASTAPYIGLFGTVLGVINAFQALANSSQAGANVVSGGIAAALVCTAAGLAVAVPSVVAYNVFIKKVAHA